MSGGTSEVYRDSDYMATGTHRRGTSTTLADPTADFKSCGISVGSYIENVTGETSSHVATVTESQITTDDSISWAAGDTYKIYMTATKGSVISTQWCDLSRGWKTPKRDLMEGWRDEDIDLDRDNPGRVFGPNQPGKP